MSEVLLFSTATTIGVLGFGFLLGLKHAVEADHLAAVSTIVSDRKSLWSSALIGGLWGVGHTISLFLAGIFVLLLDFRISEHTGEILEFCVGIMLTILGVNVIRKLYNGGHLHFHAHDHGVRKHVHPHIHTPDGVDEPATHHGLRFSPRALVVGMIHGFAGSAALMIALIPTIESKTIGLAYILIFGAGSIGGMMLMSLLVGLPFHLTAKKLDRFNYILQAIAGVASIVIGLSIMYEKGITGGLLI